MSLYAVHYYGSFMACFSLSTSHSHTRSYSCHSQSICTVVNCHIRLIERDWKQSTDGAQQQFEFWSKPKAKRVMLECSPQSLLFVLWRGRTRLYVWAVDSPLPLSAPWLCFWRGLLLGLLCSVALLISCPEELTHLEPDVLVGRQLDFIWQEALIL